MSRCIALVIVIAGLVVPAVVAQTPRPSTPIAVFVSAAETPLPGTPTQAERVEHSASFKAAQARHGISTPKTMSHASTSIGSIDPPTRAQRRCWSAPRS